MMYDVEEMEFQNKKKIEGFEMNEVEFRKLLKVHNIKIDELTKEIETLREKTEFLDASLTEETRIQEGLIVKNNKIKNKLHKILKEEERITQLSIDSNERTSIFQQA